MWKYIPGRLENHLVFSKIHCLQVAVNFPTALALRDYLSLLMSLTMASYHSEPKTIKRFNGLQRRRAKFTLKASPLFCSVVVRGACNLSSLWRHWPCMRMQLTTEFLCTWGRIRARNSKEYQTWQPIGLPGVGFISQVDAACKIHIWPLNKYK